MSNDNLKAGHRIRVRDKYKKLGSFESYLPYEVLELLLFYAIPRRDTKTTAKNLVASFGSVKGVLNADINALKKISGVGDSAAILLNAIGQASRYISQEDAEEIRGAGDMGEYALHLMKGKTVEEFYAVALSPKNEIINTRMLASGGTSSVNVNIGDIVKFSMDSGADKIVLIHNHTNGNPTPSGEDVEITGNFIDIASKVGVNISDHIITGDGRFVSMCSGGLIKKEGGK
ncbi:MAG: hypothetical protein IKT39_04195 [Clostridia bacterium]|nr:hypothetical protein [Clostridia bacterium]